MPFSFPLFYFSAVTCAAVLLQTDGSVLVVWSLFFIFHYPIMLLVFSSLLVVLPLNILSNVIFLGYFWRKKNDILRSVKKKGTKENHSA